MGLPFLLQNGNMQNQIESLVEDSVKSLGYELVQLKIHGTTSKTVEILIDRLDGKKVSFDDCIKLNKHVSALLDVEDVIADKYFLEVTSVGIERPLVKISDYERFKGKEAKIRLKEPIDEKSSIKGILSGYEGDEIFMEVEGQTMKISFDNIKSGKLVMSDEMFQRLLKGEK